MSVGDVTDDIFEVASVALSADCRFAVYGNRSLFADTFGRLFLVDMSGSTPQRLYFIDTDEDINDVQYLEGLDLFLVSSFESESLSTYRVEGNRLVKVHSLTRQGLIAGVAVVQVMDSTQLVVGSIHAASGSRIGTTSIDEDGVIQPIVWRSLGEGAENIPSVVSHSAWVPTENGE